MHIMNLFLKPNVNTALSAVIFSFLPFTLTGTFLLPSMAIAADKVSYSQQFQAERAVFSEAELAQILAPIALYPDTLLSHILIASTYPLEVIEAERFLAENSKLSETRLAKKIAQQDWDESVKALASFPRIMNKLSDDLTWMQRLSAAFLSDEEQVLASIQQLRHQAEQAGSLAELNNLSVVKEDNIIIISAPSPKVVYVPYYDTRVVYGAWHWRHHPPVYWDIPVNLTYRHGRFYWHSAIRLSGSFFFSAFHWHNRHIVIHQQKHAFYRKKYYAKRTSSYQGKRWQHKRYHHHYRATAHAKKIPAQRKIAQVKLGNKQHHNLTKKLNDHKFKRHHEKAAKKSVRVKQTKRVEHTDSQLSRNKALQQQNLNKVNTQGNSKKSEYNKLNRAKKNTHNGQQKRKRQQVNRQKNKQQGQSQHKQKNYAANRHQEQNRR